jgi:hypothetical protein
MFGWLFGTSQARAMASVIHEMSCFAFEMQNTLGSPLHKFFSDHPMLVNHQEPNDLQVHTFWLSDENQGFKVMVRDKQEDVAGSGWVTISPDRDFSGVNVQSTEKGRYIVTLTPSALRSVSGLDPVGRLAQKLVAEFDNRYGAAIVSS